MQQRYHGGIVQDDLLGLAIEIDTAQIVCFPSRIVEELINCRIMVWK
jgi:hypothetical protein